MIDELNQSERLFVWALRHWVTALKQDPHGHVGLLRYEFRRQFADAGDTGFNHFTKLMQVLATNVRRPFSYGPLCCRAVSDDEVLLTSLIGACQRGHWIVARDRAEQLVTDGAVGDLIATASALGQTLHARSCEFCADRVAKPELATLH